jgi:hypothetical protein
MIFIAMNQFDVDPARGAEFEARWRERETDGISPHIALQSPSCRQPVEMRVARDPAKLKRCRGTADAKSAVDSGQGPDESVILGER